MRPSGKAVRASAVALLALGMAGCAGEPAATNGPSTAPSAQASDGLLTIPEWDEQDDGAHTPIEPGRYLVPSSGWSVADFTVTFPEGWTEQYGHAYAKNGDEADELGFYAVVVDKIFRDSCAPDDETERMVGPRVDDLYAALREQMGGAAISEPVSTTLGGYPATRIDFKVPKHLDLAGCRMGPDGLQIWYSEPADKYFVLLADATASAYVVDLQGKRQVFLTQTSRSASGADRAEMQTVLDSIDIEGGTSFLPSRDAASPGRAVSGSRRPGPS